MHFCMLKISSLVSSDVRFSISIIALNGTSQEVGKKIAEIIGCADGYYYM